MGAGGVSTTRAKTSTSTDAARARSNARAQASTVAPEVRTSSISTIRRPCTADFFSGGTLNAPCTLSARLGQTDLLQGRAHPSQRVAEYGQPGRFRDNRGQRAGLVVAAAPAAAPVQRDRHQRIGVPQKLASRPRHPAAHDGRKIGAVLILQPVHKRARDVVVADGGAGALIGRRIGDGLHRQQARSRIVDKGNAEPRAERRRDERELRPARRADTVACDRFVARDAERRQDDVERGAGK